MASALLFLRIWCLVSGHDGCWAGGRRLPEGLTPACGPTLGLGCASAFTDFHGHRVSRVSRHVRRTSRGDLPAGPAGCRHRAAGLGAAASEDGMQTALQTCGAHDGPANLGDGPELLEPARRTVHFCGWPVSHRGSRQAWQWTQVQPGLPRVLLRRVCLRPHSDSFSFKCFVFRLLFTKAEVYIYSFAHPDCQDGGEVHRPCIVRPVVESHVPRSRRQGEKA